MDHPYKTILQEKLEKAQARLDIMYNKVQYGSYGYWHSLTILYGGE